jgi:replicative DNA helicase
LATAKEFVYDAANEALVMRAAVALALEDRPRFRALVHAIGEDEFLVPQHCSLWRVLRRMADAALDYTPETVRQLGASEATAIDDNHLAEIESTAVVPANLDWHVQTLRWDATRARVLQGGLPELVQDLRDPRVTVDRAVSSARSVVRALEGGGGRRFIHRREELAAVYRSELGRRRTQGNFYPMGIDPVDRLMSEGFMPGKTAIITGLSGSWKSTFAAKLAINLAKLGRRPLICAWEMGGTSTLDVITSMLTSIPLDVVIKGTYTDEELRRLERASDWANRKILFMENAFFGQVATGSSEKKQKRSNERNLDILEGYIAESGCDEVIMDLWDRILADQSPDAVTEALYRQQNMHVEYGVHGTLLVQLRLKDVEKRADKRPTRESIKGVGTFVEVADLIFGVHRDAQFKDVPDNTLELICLKQRKGSSNWAVRFGWDGATCQITGGEEIPYNPGLEATSEYGEVADPSAIRTRPRRGGINHRD